MANTLVPLPIPYCSSDFDVYTLTVESKALKGNPLGDTHVRSNYVLKPRAEGRFPVVFHLSGYFGTGYQAFNFKTLEENLPESISRETADKTIPLAHHVFVDATTAFGGSQFIDSVGCGDYAEYLKKDLVSAVDELLPTRQEEHYRCLLGASSGGYGALYHIAQDASPFGVAAAIAPDSVFEISLLADYYKVSEALKEIPDLKALQKKLKDAKFRSSKSFFPIMNAVAMALCYSDSGKGKINYPIDLNTGVINAEEFAVWKKKDPTEFLEQKVKNLNDVTLYLDVGRFDEYSLQFGVRRIHELLKRHKIVHHYSEFDGGHFKTSPRKIEALRWLKRIWKEIVV